MTTRVTRPTVTRGSQVCFSADFIDANGSAFAPSNATVYVAYTANGLPANTSVQMSAQANGTWVATWVATGLDLGVVDWTISCQGSVSAATNGSFVVIGNRATP